MKPILILHSDDDKSVPIQQALDMVQALEKTKVRHRFVHYKDKGHISMTGDVILICKHLGLEDPTEANELKELAQTTPVATLVNEIAEKLGESNNDTSSVG